MPAISHYMTKQPWTISRKATLAEAHQMMREHEIRHLPVLDNGELVGVVQHLVGDFPLQDAAVRVHVREVRLRPARHRRVGGLGPGQRRRAAEQDGGRCHARRGRTSRKGSG